MVPYTKGAEEKAIFMYSTATTAGDEIGWDFVTSVITTKSSFSVFSKEMTRKYQTTNIMAGPFMSPNTFINSGFVDGLHLSRLTSAKKLILGVITT